MSETSNWKELNLNRSNSWIINRICRWVPDVCHCVCFLAPRNYLWLGLGIAQSSEAAAAAECACARYANAALGFFWNVIQWNAGGGGVMELPFLRPELLSFAAAKVAATLANDFFRFNSVPCLFLFLETEEALSCWADGKVSLQRAFPWEVVPEALGTCRAKTDEESKLPLQSLNSEQGFAIKWKRGASCMLSGYSVCHNCASQLEYKQIIYLPITRPSNNCKF